MMVEQEVFGLRCDEFIFHTPAARSAAGACFGVCDVGRWRFEASERTEDRELPAHGRPCGGQPVLGRDDETAQRKGGDRQVRQRAPHVLT